MSSSPRKGHIYRRSIPLVEEARWEGFERAEFREKKGRGRVRA